MSQAGMRKSWVVRKKAQALMRLLSVKGASGAHSAYIKLVPACQACLYLQLSIKSKAASVSKVYQIITLGPTGVYQSCLCTLVWN